MNMNAKTWVVRAGIAGILLSLAGAAHAAWVSRPQPDLQEQLKKRTMLQVEDVCIPVRTTQVAHQWFVLNADGKTYDVLQWYYKGYKGPTTAAIADLGAGTIRTQGFRTGKQVNAAGVVHLPLPDGRVFISSPGVGGVHIFTYDPKTNAISDTGLAMPALNNAQRLTLGTDGLIYGAGTNNAEKRIGVFVIDPATNKLTDLGCIGPAASYAMSIAVDDTHIYLVTRKGKWSLVAWDRRTRKEEVLLTTTTSGVVSAYQRPYGCSAQGRGLVGMDGKPHHYWLYKGKAIEHVDHSSDWPWERPKDAEPWRRRMRPRIDVDKKALVPDVEGKATLRYRFNDEEEWKSLAFEVPLYPVRTHRLILLPDGRLFGKATFYHGEFVLDPKTGASEYLGRTGISYSGSVIVHEGKAYISGYSSSRLAVYDPERPVKHSDSDFGRVKLPMDTSYNPRYLAIMRRFSGTHVITDSAVGADGKVYFAGNSYRDTNRGGLAWWDPAKDEGGGVWEPFSNVAISYMTSVADGKYFVMSTFPKKDVELGKPTPKAGKLMVWDVAQAKVVREIVPIEKGNWTGIILGLDDRRVLGLTPNPADKKTFYLYGVDILTGEVAFRKIVPNPETQIRTSTHQGKYRHDLVRGPDGKVYAFMQSQLVRIDPETTMVEVVGYFGGRGDMVFVGNDIYVAGNAAVRRVRGVVGK